MTHSLNPIFSKITLSKDQTTQPLYIQLINNIESLIRNGFLKERDQLPSSRVLAQHLGVSRVTINLAYKKLIDEGWIASKKGSGCFVSQTASTYIRCKTNSNVSSFQPIHKKLPKLAAIAESSLQYKVQEEIPFALTAPDMESLPGKEWTTIVARLSKSPWRHNSYSEPGGYRPFRKAIANYLRNSRGISCDSDQVIITTGIQDGLNLSTQALFSPGETFVVEDPYFIPHKDLLEFRGLNIRPLEVGPQGLNTESLDCIHDASGILVSPCHQFPTGYLMNLDKKYEIIRWANQTGAWILENDYDNELCTENEISPAIASIDPGGSTIYLGSFTKTIYPGFNMGYVVVPKLLSEVFEGIKHLTMRHSSEVHSTILTEFIEGGFYEAHIRRLRRMYEKRRTLSIQLINQYLSEFGKIEENAGGTHLTFVFNRVIDDVKLTKYLLKEHRIESLPLSTYFISPLKKFGLVLGFVHFKEDSLEKSYAKLTEAIKLFLTKRPS